MTSPDPIPPPVTLPAAAAKVRQPAKVSSPGGARLCLPDPFSPALDRAVAVLTILCAACLVMSAFGTQSSVARSLDPIIIIEAGRQ